MSVIRLVFHPLMWPYVASAALASQRAARTRTTRSSTINLFKFNNGCCRHHRHPAEQAVGNLPLWNDSSSSFEDQRVVVALAANARDLHRRYRAVADTAAVGTPSAASTGKSVDHRSSRRRGSRRSAACREQHRIGGGAAKAQTSRARGRHPQPTAVPPGLTASARRSIALASLRLMRRYNGRTEMCAVQMSALARAVTRVCSSSPVDTSCDPHDLPI